MNTTTETTDHTTRIGAVKQVRTILTLFVAILATLIAMAPTAAAEPVADFEILEIDEWEPIIPEPEVLLLDPEILDDLPWLFLLTADATIDCGDNGAIDIEIGNETNSFTMLQVLVDDIVVANPTVGPNMAWIGSFPPAAENSTVNVKVEGDTTVLDTDLEVDCLAPDPWFEFIPNCDLGQAWVELGNNGPDEALMGVHYDDLPHAPGTVLPGTSSVQPLAVNPNEFVGFAIEVDGDPIHTDGFFFDCPIPEPEPQPEPEPEPEPEAEEEDTDEEIDNTGADTDANQEHEGGKSDPTPTEGGDTDESETSDQTDGTDESETSDQTDGTDESETSDETDDQVATGTDEIALGGGIETDAGSTSNAILVALLLTFGVVMVVGSVAAMKLRR